MSVWVTLILSLLAVGGMLGGAFLLVIGLLEGRKKQASPKLSLMPGQGGGIGLTVRWDPSSCAAQFYRATVSFYSPEHQNKEGRFSVTFAQPQIKPFAVTLEFPERFQKLVNEVSHAKAIVSVSVRSVEELMLETSMSLSKFVKLLKGAPAKLGPELTIIPKTPEDAPDVLSLDYEEYVTRNARLDTLRAQAKAKEAAQAKAKAAAAAKPPAPESKPQEKPVEKTVENS